MLDSAEMGHKVGMVNTWKVAMARTRGQMENLKAQVFRAD